jgi:Acetyltransferase (GNAT) domain
LLLSLLQSLLPTGAVRILWVGADPDGVAAGLAAAGHPVTLGAGALSAPDTPGGLYEVVILPGAAEDLAAARAHLVEDGRLFLSAPTSAARERIVALSEAGFVILREESPGEDRRLLVARRDPFVVRAFREGDEAALLDLFRTSFHVERSVERWRWEYRENPYGSLQITEAFASDGSLVAHYAGYPVHFSDLGGKRLPALQVGDTMTAAAFRHVGRGPTSLLGRSVRHFYARNCEGQIAFNYGFNTGNIQRFSMRFVRAERLEDCPYRVREVGPGFEGPRGIGWLGRLGWRIERVRRFDNRFDELFHRVRDAYGLLIERDAGYLDWRLRHLSGHRTSPTPSSVSASSPAGPSSARKKTAWSGATR